MVQMHFRWKSQQDFDKLIQNSYGTAKFLVLLDIKALKKL